LQRPAGGSRQSLGHTVLLASANVDPSYEDNGDALLNPGGDDARDGSRNSS
jgi:hypothetical protein